MTVVRSLRADGVLLLVPVKSTRRGKSRLGVDGALRRRLALAMALDTVTAAAAAPRVRAVLALVEDDEDGVALAGVGSLVHRVTVAGLNESIEEGLALPAAADGPVATLPGDLPSLQSAELDAALLAAAAHPFAVVADRDGTGTTLLTASRRELLTPRYGADSLAAHVRAGAVLVDVVDGSGLRRDVDLAADLLDVSGPHTRRVLSAAVDIAAARDGAGGRIELDGRGTLDRSPAAS